MENKSNDQSNRVIYAFFERFIRLTDTLNVEQKEYEDLLKKNTTLRGLILNYHLTSEQLVVQELQRLSQFHSLKLPKRIDKMTYAEKLNALPRQLGLVAIKKGLKELNALRNRMAHELDFLPSEQDIPNIKKCLELFTKDLGKKKPKTLDEFLLYFLKFCILTFALRSGKSRISLDDLVNRYPFLQSALKRVIG